ncbi:MAG TPA: thermonuclease family protein [Micropepsaceae bacterium]|nr:thermonuclease family protein [Micropepsaceae bacterium]
MPVFRAWSLPAFAGVSLLMAAAAQNSTRPALERLIASGLEGPVAAKVERVIDGDTIQVNAAIWIGQSLSIRIRIDGIDAPELEARCTEERRLAEKARDYLIRRLSGEDVKLAHIVNDKYGGRVRAEVRDEKGDIGQAMLEMKLARPYHGERRQSWCTGRT